MRSISLQKPHNQVSPRRKCPCHPGGTLSTTPRILCRVYGALVLRRIDWPSLRLWFAFLEARVRAAFAGAEGNVYREAAVLMGGRWTAKTVKKAEDKFARLGLLSVVGVLRVDDVELDMRAASMCAKLGHDNVDGSISLPRRHVRWLVARKKPAVTFVATLIAHLLRGCLAKRSAPPWYAEFRNGGDYRGCAIASWIADVFGVDETRVHTSRKHLIADQLFIRIPTCQRVQQLFGAWLVIAAGPVAGIRAGARPPRKMHVTATPISKPRTFKKLKNQKTGNYSDCDPSWHNIRQADLSMPIRHLALYRAAVVANAVDRSQAGKLFFFTALARAGTLADRNRAGFLRRLVEFPQYRHFLSDTDEDRGRQLLRESETAEAAGAPPLHPAVHALVFSLADGDPETDTQAEADWPLVARLRRHLNDADVGAHEDRYAAVIETAAGRQLLAGWTRERWDRATAYIDGE